MAEDTKNLVIYTPRSYPIIAGGERDYLVAELQRVSNALKKAVEVMRLMEARMNSNGLS